MIKGVSNYLLNHHKSFQMFSQAFVSMSFNRVTLCLFVALQCFVPNNCLRCWKYPTVRVPSNKHKYSGLLGNFNITQLHTIFSISLLPIAPARSLQLFDINYKNTSRLKPELVSFKTIISHTAIICTDVNVLTSG